MSASPPPSPSRKPLRRGLLVLGLLAVAVIAAPTIIGYTPLPSSLLASQLPPEAGRLSTREATLGWSGPLALQGVELRDPAGAVLFSAESVDVDAGLLGLLTGDVRRLDVRVVRPRVDLVVTPDGSNFDAVIAALQQKAAESAAPQPGAVANASRPIAVTVVEGAARVTDCATRQSWVAEGVNASVTGIGEGIDALELDASGELTTVAAQGAPPPPRGEFSLRIGEAQGGGRLARGNASSVPLSVVGALLRRADPQASLDGWASVEGEAAWASLAGAAPPTGAADLARQLIAAGLRSSGEMTLSGVEYLGAATGRAPVRLGMVVAPWSVAAAGDRLRIDSLEARSEVGDAALRGALTVPEIERWASGVLSAPTDLTADAEVDFGRLAAVAPQLVHLREGSRIDSGAVQARVSSQQGRVTATLASGALAGVSGGRRVAWREPLDVRIVARQRGPGVALTDWNLEDLQAKSSFFQAAAEGDAARMAGRVRVDLDRLAQELAPLIDLGSTQLAGRGEARFTILRDEPTGRWRLEADGDVERLLVGPPAAPLASEPQLAFNAKLAGAFAEPALPAGTVELTAGDDRLAVRLPAEGRDDDTQPFELRLAGDAARWYRRLGVALSELPPPERIGLAGPIEVTAAGVASPTTGRLDRFNAALGPLSLDTAPLGGATRVRFANERIELAGKARWNAELGALEAPEGQLVSSVASARLRNVNVSLADPSDASGEAVFRADLAGLGSWLPPADGPLRWQATGLVDGSMKLRGVPEGLNVVVTTQGQNLTLVDRTPPSTTGAAAPPQTVWSEPSLRVDANALVASVARGPDQSPTYSVEVREAKVQSQTVSGSGGGRIDDLLALRGVQVGGGVDYDLERLTPMLWPSVGDGVRLVGRDRATFRLESNDGVSPDAPWAQRLRGEAAAPWQGADVFGLPIGPGRVVAKLDSGVVRTDPLDVTVGGGRLTTAAAVTLDPPPQALSLQPGPLVTDVAISREVSDKALKYIAPVFADAARVEGRFSMGLSELAVPLEQPAGAPPAGRATGRLQVHTVRVTPGPSVAQWIGVVKQIEGVARNGVEGVAAARETTLVSIRDQAIDFQLVEGRVYHRGLRFEVGDAVVESTGSVGLDETLDLVLSVPILDEWIDRKPQLLGRLRGQAVRIPVRGTFNRPKVDDRAFVQLSRQLIEGAAAGAIESGLRRLFEKL